MNGGRETQPVIAYFFSTYMRVRDYSNKGGMAVSYDEGPQNVFWAGSESNLVFSGLGADFRKPEIGKTFNSQVLGVFLEVTAANYDLGCFRLIIIFRINLQSTLQILSG